MNEPCVCCGEPDQDGTCGEYTVCWPCYETGLFAEWLQQYKPEDYKRMCEKVKDEKETDVR